MLTFGAFVFVLFPRLRLGGGPGGGAGALPATFCSYSIIRGAISALAKSFFFIPAFFNILRYWGGSNLWSIPFPGTTERLNPPTCLKPVGFLIYGASFDLPMITPYLAFAYRYLVGSIYFLMANCLIFLANVLACFLSANEIPTKPLGMQKKWKSSFLAT